MHQRHPQQGLQQTDEYADEQQRQRDAALRALLLKGRLRSPMRQQHIGQRAAGQQTGKPVRQRQHQHRHITGAGHTERSRLGRFAQQSQHAAGQQQRQGQGTGFEQHGRDYRGAARGREPRRPDQIQQGQADLKATACGHESR